MNYGLYTLIKILSFDCELQSPSRVKISDITFNDIRGTSSSAVAVTLNCSKAFPCENIKFNDIDIGHNKLEHPVKSKCLNAKPKYSGTQEPAPCKD